MNDKDLKKFIKESIIEDLGDGDHTSLATISKSSKNKSQLLIKDNGIIAGIDLAKLILNQVNQDLRIDQLLNDGDQVRKGDIAFTVEGCSISILSAERLVLNCMQRMSAISTKTYYLNKLLKDTDTKLLDTRKTTPFNRKIEKWAVKIGGGTNHRFGLYDVIMIKDNHTDVAGGIQQAIIKTKAYLKRKKKKLDIIVEARNIKEVKEIINEGGIKRILLDNFNITETKQAIKIINNKYETESSGGITEKNILRYAECGVNYISLGCLTHSIKNFDLSLKKI